MKVQNNQCSMLECQRPVRCRDLCARHYRLKLRYGDPSIYKNKPFNQECSVAGCELMSEAQLLCAKHYNRWRKHGNPERTIQFVGEGSTRIERFWSKVAITANDNLCWVWLGSQCGTDNAYGLTRFNGVRWTAHRLAWSLANGRLPTKCILHSCDNPPCVNPKHLREGTQHENMRDKTLRKRHPRKRI
jgi:hypothetical protein